MKFEIIFADKLTLLVSWLTLKWFKVAFYFVTNFKTYLNNDTLHQLVQICKENDKKLGVYNKQQGFTSAPSEQQYDLVRKDSNEYNHNNESTSGTVNMVGMKTPRRAELTKIMHTNSNEAVVPSINAGVQQQQ